jgi:omega-6 fatty acid desaturase (delta-12 desaturase)
MQTITSSVVNFASLEAMKSYCIPSAARSTFQLVNSLAAYIAGWFLMLWLVDINYGIALIAAIPVSGFLVRLFIIFHDCGHGSFFRSRRANAIVGSIIGVLTFTPYDGWRRRHAQHHANTGKLVDDRSVGTILTLTVKEYQALTPWRRFLYRVYRHPLIQFGAGAIFHIVIGQRFPQQVPLSWRHIERRSVFWTDFFIVAGSVAVALLVGWRQFLLVQLPIMAVSAIVGNWLFFVQHNFENAYWQDVRDWDYHEASLFGSSHYDLPVVLRWFTGNIGFHHVHHLNSRIPNYRLKECLDENPDLQTAPRFGFWISLRCAVLALWDEDRGVLVRFRDLDAAGSKIA